MARRTPSEEPGRAFASRAERALHDHAASYPGAVEQFPWGERVIKVRGKAFAFFFAEGQGFSLSTKLPETGALALMLPFAEPTSHGLGASGWVTATFGRRDQPPLAMLRQWIDESYRAVAPRKLVAALDRAKGGPTKARRRSR